MRIAWLTPFSVRSAIGEFGKWACDELSRSAEVDIWTGSTGELHETSLAVRRLPRGAAQEHDQLAHYDLRVYNMGDYLDFHDALYEASRRCSGIVILHDRVYQNLFAPYWLSRDRPDVYVSLMEEFYGAEGRLAAERSVGGAGSAVWQSEDEILRFPLFEEVIWNAEGVITHASDHADLVRERWLGPVKALFLPSYPSDARALEPAASDATPLRILTVGHVNRNKQAHRVVEALMDDPALAERCVYHVIGPIDEDGPYAHDLHALIERSGLGERVQLLGYQPDEVLQEYMARAHVFVNLRKPPMEGASASLVRQLMWGKPTVVHPEGSFAEIPPGAAVTVPADDSSLAPRLRELADSPELRAAIGSAGLEWARSRSVAGYVAELLQFFEEARAWRPVLGLCDRVGRELQAMSVDPRLGAVDKVAAELSAVIRPEPRS